ncbi:MAG TPA: GNAT family N-acetyltransferase [Nocardioides sp.]|nr:GNAT family N-acetyltransferase [Nocardioides sp.]
MRASFETWETWIGRINGRIVASVRARLVDDVWDIGRLMVAVDVEGRGIGRALLAFIEGQAPASAEAYELFTGARSERNQRMYALAGYQILGPSEIPGAVRLRKVRPADSA